MSTRPDQPKSIAVVGGGISGLAVAHALVERAAALARPVDVRLFEQASRLGGTMFTEPAGGFHVEWGPNGFLDSKPHTAELAARLGLADALLPASDASSRRWVLSRGRLRPIPTSPQRFLFSSLLSMSAKWRVLREPAAPPPPDGVDETIAAFARRRLGPETAARLIDPFVSGVFSGDPETLSVRSAFPRLVELEREYGSLLRASRKLKAKGAGPAGKLTSFTGGMSTLVSALAKSLGPRAATRAAASALTRGSGDTLSLTVDGEARAFDAVVLATPTTTTQRLLAPLDDAFVAPLAHIPYAAVAVVALGFARESVAHPLDGFGFLIPSEERQPILGCLFDSSAFPGHRAPPGHVLLRAFVGGARAPERVDEDDAALVRLVRGVLDPLLGLRGEPVLTRVVRHRSAIPQYVVGHADRVAAIDAAAARVPGLCVAGNALRGVGVNDCTREAEAVAARVLSS